MVYASIYDPDSDETALTPIETDEEWQIIESILQELQEEAGKENEENES